MEEVITYSLDTINSENGALEVKDFNEVKRTANKIIAKFEPPTSIADDAELRIAKANRASINTALKMTQDKRKAVVRELTGKFDVQMKELERMFKDTSDAYKRVIDEYKGAKDSEKATPTNGEIIVKVPAGEMGELLFAFLKANKIEYTERN